MIKNIEELFTKKEKKVEMIFENSNTILAGGLDKEDDKLNIEIFLDKEKDKEKIERFLFPKNLVNQYKFVDGKKINIETYNGENLLIKGNNLQALHTLKERYTNKIDVIYIDPPYYFNSKKSHDCFAYNSNFELSTWLVFMKNRLEIAKELLSDSGVIFISMNEDGYSYLKLLCDEIFGLNNFITNMPIINTSAIKNNSKVFSKMHEFCSVYSKNINNVKKLEKSNPIITNVNNIKYNIKNSNKDNKKELLENELISYYNSKEYKKMILELGNSFDISDYWMVDEDLNIFGYSSLDAPGSKVSFDIEHPITNNICNKASRGWSISFDTYIENKNKKILTHKKNKLTYYTQGCIIFGEDEHSKIPGKVKYLENNQNLIMKSYMNVSNGTQEFNNLKLSNSFENPKPTFLIKELLRHIDKKDAIILDFFAGSGTTGHAVMDLNKEDGGTRKFILIEQMDYIETISAERIKRSINKFNYKENFVYCELEESPIKELKRKLKSIQTKEILYDFVEKHFESKKDEIFSYFNVIEEIAPKKANKLLEMIRILFLYYIPSEYDYTVFDNTNDFSKSLIKYIPN